MKRLGTAHIQENFKTLASLPNSIIIVNVSTKHFTLHRSFHKQMFPYLPSQRL